MTRSSIAEDGAKKKPANNVSLFLLLVQLYCTTRPAGNQEYRSRIYVYVYYLKICESIVGPEASRSSEAMLNTKSDLIYMFSKFFSPPSFNNFIFFIKQ